MFSVTSCLGNKAKGSKKQKIVCKSLRTMFPPIQKEEKEVVVDEKPAVDKIQKQECMELQQIESKSGLKYDIANIIKDRYNDKERIQIIENVWRPHKEYKFPISKFLSKDGKESFDCCKFVWLEKQSWLVYCASKDVLFCLPCLLFGGSKKAKLVSTGLNYWKSALTKFLEHEKIHGFQLEKYNNFIVNMKNPERGIDAQADQLEAGRIAENRSRVRLLMKCVEFVGKFNISLRSKKESSKYYKNPETGKKFYHLFSF